MSSIEHLKGLYSIHHLEDMGIELAGDDIRIDSSVKIFNPKHVRIGNHVRIDANCLISVGGGLEIGSYVHVASGSSISGHGHIRIESFCGLSAGVRIFSSNDDYSGGALTNPTVPDEYRAVSSGPVTLEEHVIIGTNSIILPNVTVGKGAAVGALTLVNKDVPDFAIVAGAPFRKIGHRPNTILQLGQKLLDSKL